MTGILWLYEWPHWLVFLFAFAALYLTAWIGFWLGTRYIAREPKDKPQYLTDFVPSTILGVLALILGFSFSMAVSRFENRRQLVIEEANAIGTAYLRSRLLRQPRGAAIGDLLRKYLDMRIESYEVDSGSPESREIAARLARVQDELWGQTVQATKIERAAIEGNFVIALNAVFDIGNERSIALRKSLPPMIYAAILFIAAVGLMAFSFTRGQKLEHGQWPSTILVLLNAFVLNMILDIERPRDGTIRITQEAMIDLRESINQGRSAVQTPAPDS